MSGLLLRVNSGLLEWYQRLVYHSGAVADEFAAVVSVVRCYSVGLGRSSVGAVWQPAGGDVVGNGGATA